MVWQWEFIVVDKRKGNLKGCASCPFACQSFLVPRHCNVSQDHFAGFWTLQHFLRPLRFTVAIAMAPAFDRILVSIQRLTGWNKRNAFGLYLVLFGSLTSFLVFGSIFLFGGAQAFARS